MSCEKATPGGGGEYPGMPAVEFSKSTTAATLQTCEAQLSRRAKLLAAVGCVCAAAGVAGIVILTVIGETDKPAMLAIPAAAVVLGLLMAAQFLRSLHAIGRPRNMEAPCYWNDVVGVSNAVGFGEEARKPKKLSYISSNVGAHVPSSDELWPAPCSCDGLPRFHQGQCCNSMCSATQVSLQNNRDALTAVGTSLSTMLLSSDMLALEHSAPVVRGDTCYLDEAYKKSDNLDTCLKSQLTNDRFGMSMAHPC